MAGTQVVTSLAVSEDGDTFTKPELGLVLNGHDTNIVFPPAYGPWASLPLTLPRVGSAP